MLDILAIIITFTSKQRLPFTKDNTSLMPKLHGWPDKHVSGHLFKKPHKFLISARTATSRLFATLVTVCSPFSSLLSWYLARAGS